ncbi:MAG: prepilin-type N-terminal cleavage/methylation domain-containing protein [Nocardioides sp.]|uniref:prepilin-type N-terminal cleavage/methylation domain-containing protein n=1 Tax=Nocardioides sp. TaxID=35761 RepID=UPI003F0F70D9
MERTATRTADDRRLPRQPLGTPLRQESLRRPATAPTGLPHDPQAGLSLVEVIVAISLLGIFAIVFAPVLYHGLGITSSQATVAYSAQRASSYIDDARAATAASSSCAALLAATSGASPTISTDPRQQRVKVSGAVQGCETTPTVPTAVTLTVTACRPAAASADTAACASGDRTLTVVSTKILVRG